MPKGALTRTLSLLLFSIPVLASAVDKSQWPRVAPVLLIHGVGSSPAMWGLAHHQDATGDQFNRFFPIGDNSKSGNYFWFHADRKRLAECNDAVGTQDIWTRLGSGTLTLNAVAKCGSAPPGKTTPTTYFRNTLETGANVRFVINDDKSLAGLYEKLQSRYGGSRSLKYGVTGDYGFDGAKSFQTTTFDGFAAQTGLPKALLGTDSRSKVGSAERNNGIEVFDSYWTFGWADGSPPAELTGPEGMLYGMHMNQMGSYVNKAKYLRTVTYYTSSGKTYEEPMLQENWNARITAMPNLETDVKNYFYKNCRVITSGYPITKDSTSNSTILYQYKLNGNVHEHLYSINPNGFQGPSLLIAYSANPVGYEGVPFREETKYGQVGQLYLAIKRVLDKYYVAPDGTPNWMGTDGNSEADAKIVLVGHSQGGVISRAVLYPGLQSSHNTYDPSVGYFPMYWPKDLIGATYRNPDDGSIRTMEGYFDPRRHVAGVVQTSAPNYGSEIGFMLEGLLNFHKELLELKKKHMGLYTSLWSPGTFSLIGEVGSKIINEVNPVYSGGLSAELLVNPQTFPNLREWQGKSGFVTHNVFRTTVPLPNNQFKFVPGISDPATGKQLWQNMGDNPCAAFESAYTDANGPNGTTRKLVTNTYRLFWQPEYDNWVRSFRFNEGNNSATGLAGERALDPYVASMFKQQGTALCNEQVGFYTHLETNLDDPAINPFNGYFKALMATAEGASGLAKTSAASGTASTPLDPPLPPELEQIQSNLKGCVLNAAKNTTNYVLAGISLASPPLLNAGPIGMAAYMTYNAAMDCIETAMDKTSKAVQYEFHRQTTMAAQGLALHPASTFLHKLNQRGGAHQQERRPYPTRPDGQVIPFVSIVNRVARNGNPTFIGRARYSDLAVGTMSQDLGFGYPDIAKAGSLAKLSFTGYWHGEAGTMDPVTAGPIQNGEPSYNYAENQKYREKSRRTVANVILGLAIGQSPVFPNQGKGSAKLSEIEARFTKKDIDGYTLQRNIGGVVGNYSRLKGLDMNEIGEPVALPYDFASGQYRVTSDIYIQAGQELHLPSGSTVVFAGGKVIVQAGGRLSFGGVPSFLDRPEGDYAITLKLSQPEITPIYLEIDSHLSLPNKAENKMIFSIFIEEGNRRYRLLHLDPALAGSIACATNNLYCQYDGGLPVSRYSTKASGDFLRILRKGNIVPILMLLQ